MWTVILMEEVDRWLIDLARSDSDQADQVEAAINILAKQGPALGRPLADRIHGSRLHNMKELRPSSTTIRILFIFDPQRQAVLLVAGDKTGQWKSWYEQNIPVAEARYREWVEGERDEEV